MKILFLGGTGNISSECAALLLQREHQVAVLTRGHHPIPPGLLPIVADRSQPEAIRAALAGFEPEVVINFLGFDLPELRIDHALFRGRLRQYVFISSATVYAIPRPTSPTTESAPLGNAFWDYAARKLACEQWLLDRWHQEQFPVTIVRPSHTYSRHWIPNPISSAGYTFASRIENRRPVVIPDNGLNPWTLTAAEDFAVGLAGLLGRPDSLGEAFHITSDEVLTWNQIVSEIAAAVGVPDPIVERVPSDIICDVVPSLAGNLRGDKCHPGIFDNSKIKRFVPEFRCRIPFRDGIRASVEWLRKHPADQNLRPELDHWCDAVVAEWRRRNPRASS